MPFYAISLAKNPNFGYNINHKSMRQCSLCHKGSQMQGKRKLLRGHYNPVNWSRKYPNLQYSKVNGARKLVCTQCLRTLAKTQSHKLKTVKKETAVVAA
jgi:hypothetical protein